MSLRSCRQRSKQRLLLSASGRRRALNELRGSVTICDARNRPLAHGIQSLASGILGSAEQAGIVSSSESQMRAQQAYRSSMEPKQITLKFYEASLLPLDSPRWSELTHAYGSASDTPALLRQLASLPRADGDAEPWFSLWSSLAHQGGTVQKGVN